MKNYVIHSQRVGITEAGDPAFNLFLFDHLYRANVIITKNLTDALIERILKNRHCIILHLTCTGYGGTAMEPNVPTPETMRSQVGKLLNAGFPASQVVLRMDPIMPTYEGRKIAYTVAALFAGIGISRLRFSVLDMYKHVKERFIEKDMPIPYTSFHASERARLNVYLGLKTIADKYGYVVEACAEPNIPQTPCVSQKDLDILGINDITLKDSAQQRRACGCPANKSELIRNGQPHRCEHQCLYCFWKDLDKD